MSDAAGGTDGTGPDPSGPSLPPPAFPPGTRRHQMRRRRDREQEEDQADAGMEGAFISPDDPLPERGDGDDMADAFISPDEPLPHRAPAATTTDAAVGTATVADEEDDPVVVTGIGNDPHLDPEELQAAGDPHVMELVAKVGKLAQALKQRGEAGLRADGHMDRFEATLRAYCVGYLAGRRAEDEG